jgi:hypothetical protein
MYLVISTSQKDFGRVSWGANFRYFHAGFGNPKNFHPWWGHGQSIVDSWMPVLSILSASLVAIYFSENTSNICLVRVLNREIWQRYMYVEIGSVFT